MKHFTAIIAALLMSIAPIAAQYSVHSLQGKVQVTVRKSGNTMDAAKGMELSPMDMILIPEGGSVEIFSKPESRTYRCDTPGKMSVLNVKINAGKAARRVAGRITDNINFTRRAQEGVYVESGMVKRSLATYDPEAKNIEVDPAVLSRFVIDALRAPADSTVAMPAELIHSYSPEGGLAFSIANTIETPIYFNLLKIADGDISKVSISELGQPSGSYVLLPTQSITREQTAPLCPTEKHILIMTHFNFDIDRLIEQIEANAAQQPAADGPKLSSPDLRIYVTAL